MMILSYQAVRQKICDGDFLLCSGESDGSKIIQRISKIQYKGSLIQFTHIGIFDWWHGRLMISESCEGDGVGHNNFSNKYIHKKYKGRLFVARYNDCNDSVFIKKVMERVADAVSTDYPESDLVKIALNKLIGTKLKADPDDNTFICSELVNHSFGYVFTKHKTDFCIPNDVAYSGKVKILYEII